MTRERYTALAAGAAAVSLAVVLPLLEGPARTAVALGAGLALVNTVAAYCLFEWSRGRSTQAFLWAVLGGMGVRMALLVGLLVAGLLVLDLPKLPLAVSLLSYVALYLGLEMFVMARMPGTAAGVR